MLESRRVLQAVSDCAVDTDVGRPDERDPRQGSDSKPDTPGADGNWNEVCVGGVVAHAPGPSAGQIAEHREVGRQREEEIQPQWAANSDVGGRCRGKHDEPFSSEE